jgi:hypothetical protein
MASGIAEIVDRMATIIEATIPDYPTGTEERFRQLPGEDAIEDAPAAGSWAMTNRQFQIWPAPEVRFGQLNGTFIDITHRVELRVRYSGVQSRSPTEINKRIAADGARLYEALARPPSPDTWVGTQVLGQPGPVGSQPPRSTATTGVVVVSWFYDFLYRLDQGALLSVQLCRYTSLTDLQMAQNQSAAIGEVARLETVGGSLIGIWGWTGTASRLIGGDDACDFSEVTTEIDIGDATSGNIRPRGAGTASFSSGLVVSGEGAVFYGARQETDLDFLWVGTHQSYSIATPSDEYAGKFFSVGDLPSAGTADRLATVISETTGALTQAYKDSGTAWEEINVSQSKEVTRATAALPQSTTDALFTVTGQVTILGILGLVTTGIGAVANATKLQLNPTTGATNDLTDTTDINGHTAGYMYSATGETDDAMEATDGSVEMTFKPRGFGPGDVEINCAGSDGGTGRVQWIISYVPLSSGATIVAA